MPELPHAVIYLVLTARLLHEVEQSVAVDSDQCDVLQFERNSRSSSQTIAAAARATTTARARG